MSNRRNRYAIFQPYAQDYGDSSAVGEEKTPLAEQVAAWLPAAKTLVGLDDSRKTVTTLENRLRDLREGNAAERAAAMLAAGSPFSLEGAIEKTEAKLAEARNAAFQVESRDKLYTALTVTGVAVGATLTLVLLGQTYLIYQRARVERAEAERLGS